MTNDLKKLLEQSKLPAQSTGMGTVKKFFEVNKSAMAAVLPRHVSTDRMLKIALSAMRTTPKLMECTTESLMSSVMVCAQLGLEPNTVQGLAYLIPFSNRKENRTDVQVIIGYKGLIDLARRSGQIISIAAHAVYENDDFDFSYGLEDRLDHRPALTNRGSIIAFYAVAKLKDGGHAFEVMSEEQVQEIKASTQSKGKWGPWKDHYAEMGRKTAIRRLAKYLPMSIELSQAARLDEQAEAGEEQAFEDVLSGDCEVINDQELIEAPSYAELMDGINSAKSSNDIEATLNHIDHLPKDQQEEIQKAASLAMDKMTEGEE